MDNKPEELQFMGLFGIYREAYKITVSWRKIFSQITLFLILPLYFIYSLQIETSNLLLTKISENTKTLQETILSLVSTSAVVYTIACIYTSKEITFKKVISVVPKVWKRLIITFLWNVLIIFFYNLFAILLITVFAIVIAIFVVTGSITNPKAFYIPYIVFLVIVSIPYLVGFVYISVIWNLASVISVLEETYGLKAMKKSKSLIKGKIWIASAIFVKLQILSSAILMMFNKLVLHGASIGVVGRVSFGIFFFLLLAILIHFTLVIQTIIYFVCKSYHNENIDKSSLSDHLNVYHQAEYVPLVMDDTDLKSGQLSV